MTGRLLPGYVPVGLTRSRFKQSSPILQPQLFWVPAPGHVRPYSVAERVPFHVSFRDEGSCRRDACAYGMPKKISLESCGTENPSSIQPVLSNYIKCIANKMGTECLQVPFNVWPRGPLDVVLTEVWTADRALTPLRNEILDNQYFNILQSRQEWTSITQRKFLEEQKRS